MEHLVKAIKSLRSLWQHKNIHLRSILKSFLHNYVTTHSYQTKRFGVKELYSNNARPLTNCITYNHNRKKIQKSSTLLHFTSHHTKKAKNSLLQQLNLKLESSKEKQNPHRIFKNKTPKTNELVVCNALNFNKEACPPTHFSPFFPSSFCYCYCKYSI